MTSHEGGCLCGQVRFRVSTPALSSGYCHCRMCQKSSGAPVVAWVTFPACGFSWIAGTPRTYGSSARAKRQFCAQCGSYMLFRSEDSPDEVSVNTASLDDPGVFPPQMHIFTESRITWFHTRDALPTHQGYGPFQRPED
jgi:hypothetical protein